MSQVNKFKKRDIPKLKYGVIHSQVGFTDGVSIVMKQIEGVMRENMKIPYDHIYYLVGKASRGSPQITQNKLFWHKYSVNKEMLRNYGNGFGGTLSEKIEISITFAKVQIEEFVQKNKIEVLIVHNASHPVNFISSVALARYYRDQIKAKKKTPKYILWWHDSHLERERFAKPAHDVKRYLRQGVPGSYVDYIVFINSLQFETATDYFLDLSTRKNNYYDKLLQSHDVVYNTTNSSIDSLRDLRKSEFAEKTDKFLHDFKIRKLLQKNHLALHDVQFVLQHTRVVPRKRIDFALKYCYALFEKLDKKAMVFFVSGHSGDEIGKYKQRIIELNKQLSKEHNYDKVSLMFAEDYKTDLEFEEYPYIFASLNGISTYFSEIEGFGNNLLEVLSGGLIPVVYTYPVFVKDIAKYKFNAICLNKFEINENSLKEVCAIIKKSRVRKQMVEENIKILKKKFSHRIISAKLKRAIIRARDHI